MGLIVIRHDERKPHWFCAVCKMRGEVTTFAEDEHAAYEAHVLACSNAHEDELRRASYRNKMPHLFDPKVAGDVELDAWVRRHRQQVIDGSKNI